ncbi:MAG: ABC transporter substrate-binding protein, partial [Oscillospiraceae bacterium]
MKRYIAMLLSLTLGLSVLSGCGGEKAPEADEQSSADNGDVIKIGVFQPLTGANAAGGELEVEGIKLANKLYPEVLGKKIELVVVDNKSDKTESASAVARLIEKDKVSVILGSWGSGNSIAAGNLVKDKKVPAIGCSCTNPMVTQGNDYYFRVCFIDPFQGTIMANYAANVIGAKKAAIIQEISSDYSVGLAKFFTDSFKKLTGDEEAIVSVANYNTGDTEFSQQVTSVLSSKPDVIFAPGNFTESALIIKKIRELGDQTPVIGGDTWETDEFITVGGKDVEGVALSTFFDETDPLTPETEKFLAEYKNEYPDKNVAAVTALGYDSYLLAYKAIEAAGSADPQAIRDAIATTKDLECVTGILNLTADGDAEKDVAIIKTVKD